MYSNFVYFLTVHYQVISTPAVKLNDVHMILYLTPSAVSVIFMIFLNIESTIKINNNVGSYLAEINIICNSFIEYFNESYKILI